MSAANTPQASGNQMQSRPANNAPGSWATYDPPASQRPDYSSPYSRTTYRPTTEQLARDEARRHYLRRNVYAPLILATLIVVALFLLVVGLAFFARTPEVVYLITGLSALTIILFSIPLIALMTILPIAWLAFTFNRRQQRKQFPETGPMAYRSRVQVLLWQFDSLLDGVQRGVERGAATLRRPLNAVYAWAAYLHGLMDGIRGKSKRSI